MGHDLTLNRNGYNVEGTGEVDLGQLATKQLGNWCGVAFVGRFVYNITRSAALQGQCSYEQLGAGSI